MLPTLDRVFLQDFRVSYSEDGVALVGQLIDLFLVHSAPLIAALESAHAARDAVTLHGLLHRLSGSAATIGGVRLAALCEHLRATGPLHPDAAEQLADIQCAYLELKADLREERTRCCS